MTPIIVFDPGWMTGIVIGQFNDHDPVTVKEILQIEGGLDALEPMLPKLKADNPEAKIVCERFTPRPMARSYKIRELEPLRIEGAVQLNWESAVTWQRPASMLLAGDSGPAGKRAADDILRAGGLWSTAKTVGRKDANDANAAMKHLLAYMRGAGHQPTIERYLT